MQSRIWRILGTVLSVLLLTVTVVNAQETASQGTGGDLSTVYKKVDGAFDKKSEEDLNVVIIQVKPTASYALVENYVLKKARQLVIQNDYEFAQQATLVVIDNNLDNFDAVDLYTSIEQALARHNELLAQQAAREEAERQKRLAEDEKNKKSIEKNYQTVSLTSGNRVVLATEENTIFDPLNWDICAGVPNFMWAIAPGEDSVPQNLLKIGIKVGGDVFYKTNDITIGADFDVDVAALKLKGADDSMPLNISFMPQLALNNLNRKLFLRAGYVGFVLPDAGTTKSVLYPTFASPAVGIGMNNIAAGPCKFNFYADWLPGNFISGITNTLYFVMEGGVGMTYPLAVMSNISVNLNLDLEDKLFIRDVGVENRANVILSFGVGNVNK